MTPTNHHISDAYLDAYRGQLASDLRAAHAGRGLGHLVRTAIARSLVRAGVSLLPDGPPIVDGRVIVLQSAPTTRDLPEAA